MKDGSFVCCAGKAACAVAFTFLDMGSVFSLYNQACSGDCLFAPFDFSSGDRSAALPDGASPHPSKSRANHSNRRELFGLGFFFTEQIYTLQKPLAIHQILVNEVV